MVEKESARFGSVEAALRFYFRAQELLSAKSSLRVRAEGNIRPTGHRPRDDLMMDFLTVATALRKLTALQLWLLRALYSPRRFGDRPRTISRACEEGRRLFPRLRWTPQGLGRLRRQTLDLIEERLGKKGLVLQRRERPNEKSHREGAPGWEVNEHKSGKQKSLPGLERCSSGELSGTGHAMRKPRRLREVIFDVTPKGN
jgi:hypothetical protein